MNRQDMTALFRELRGQDNVVGVGYGTKRVRGEDTGQPSIIVLVRRKQPKGDLRRNALLPRRIDGLSTDVVEVGDLRLFDTERTGVLRPARPGSSIGHYKISAGTFGAVVRDRKTGEALILSNNHVLANLSNGMDNRAQLGDPILQPAIYDGGDLEESVVARLHRFVPFQSEETAPQCRIAKWVETQLNKWVKVFRPRYRVCFLRENERVNQVDCAVAAPVDAAAISAEILDVGLINGVREPKPGMMIKKSGRSTGLTYSIVLATAVTFEVGVSRTESGLFVDQVLAGPMSKPGDSGSLILTEDNHAVGLLFAGSDQATMFNPISRVLDALDITF